MRIKLFEEFNNSLSNTCDKCGEEFWNDDEHCNDCKDSDLEEQEYQEIETDEEKSLPSFGVPITKSQNLYYL